HLLAQDGNGRCDLANGFTLDAHAHEEGADLCRRGFARHDDAHDAAHFLAGQVLAVGDLVEGCLEVHHAAFLPLKSRAMLRKFCSRACPFSEAMLSGWNCTPWIGRVLCCMPMIRPSSVVAVTSSTSGSVSALTTSE